MVDNPYRKVAPTDTIYPGITRFTPKFYSGIGYHKMPRWFPHMRGLSAAENRKGCVRALHHLPEALDMHLLHEPEEQRLVRGDTTNWTQLNP